MTEIEIQLNLKESVIRRIIRENNYQEKRERYYKLLCFKSYFYNINILDISMLSGVSISILSRIRRKYSMDSSRFEPWNKRRDDDLDRKIIEEYKSGMTGKSLSEKYGYKTSKTIYDILSSYGIEKRPSKILTFYDEDFFTCINSHEKAYFLGFLMADGNIKKDYAGFEMQLTEDDGYILEKLSELIGANKTHGLQKVDYSSRRKKKSKARNMLRLNVCSRKISQDLKSLGVVRWKSKILEYNGSVPSEFLSSFLRGLLDGDGSIGINSQTNYPWCHICGTASEKFAKQICALHPQFSINNPLKNFWVVKVGGGKEKIYEFLKWLYKDKKDLYLRRKYEKVQDKIN